MPFLPTASSGASWHDFVKIPAASSGAFRAGGYYADIARSASTCPSKEAICYVGGICPPNPLTRMPFLPTASSGASWHHFVMATFRKTDKEVVMVVDRSGLHRAHKLDATLDHDHSKLRFHFFPAHCGHHLNPIE